MLQNNTFGAMYQYSVTPEWDITALMAQITSTYTIRKNYCVDDGYALNWPGGTAAMAVANANTFWDDFEEAPTWNADYSRAGLGDLTPKASLAGYGTAAGSTGYAHPCADWAVVVEKMGRLYTELS